MTTLSITVSGQSYSAPCSDAAHAKLETYRLQDMSNIATGEGQDADTPVADRPGYRADVQAYVEAMVIRSGQPPQEVLERIIANAEGSPPVTPEEAAPLEGEALKAFLRSYAADKRWTVESGGCIDQNGNAIATDRDSQTKLIAEMVAIGANMRTDPSPWKLRGNGFVLLTNAQMIQAIMAARTHIANSFAGEAECLAAIEAGTITTPAQVDAANWPSN
jgi:hypothetical protein